MYELRDCIMAGILVKRIWVHIKRTKHKIILDLNSVCVGMDHRCFHTCVCVTVMCHDINIRGSLDYRDSQTRF